ncbi:class I SAM-dependent methyltransferase [Demequina flava]|uniref:class I SAM-dependent methyltransferase n=1 Tax=Demequina flava TaxID=1095025 RepID=UPI0007867F6A|nr:class I SAM-dependent methyltransferase [Demequina flava]
MTAKPRETWTTYRSSIGDRSAMFAQVARRWDISSAVYPGAYLDLSPSVSIPTVTYNDMDRRAARFFADEALVTQELDGRSSLEAREVRFIHGDYTQPLDIDDNSHDLLISLYAGPVWDHCRRYLRDGGYLLANTSHGDGSVAALDPALTLVGVIGGSGESAVLDESELDSYLIPKKPGEADAQRIRQAGKGIAYTRTASAYLFRYDAAL